MKIAISSQGDNVSANLDLRFGRAAYFCIYDNETEETTFFKNQNIDAAGGAGSKTAETLVELGIKKAISGDFGPKAKTVLDQFKVQMIILQDEQKPIKDIIQLMHNTL